MVFLIISIIIFHFILYLVPKKIKRHEIYSIALFSIVLGFCSDVLFDLKYNFYGYFEKGPQLAGFLPILGLFSPAGILFLNFYPFHKTIAMKCTYILVWTLFCLVFEYFSIVFGFFYHNEWKFLYSAIAYPILLLLQIVHFRIYQTYTRKL
ncbi:CBO0543 family protein [Salirhabdus sp. Marseille-P4669]|uniref:CBO0543 family protein n=1 Tax=Salirhabdus sp. Marseille-P4669 TaxID=2042310 RepID=UPI000C7AAB79